MRVRRRIVWFALISFSFTVPGTVPGQVFWSTLFYQIRDGSLLGSASGVDYMHSGTVDCHVGFINPHDKQVSIQLSGSRVSVDFPMNHGSASITDKSTTVYPAHSSGFVHVMFSASISDFSALAKYWVYGYYDLPVTIRLLLKEAIGGKYQTYTYVIRNHVTVKTSNTVYGVVILDAGSFIAGGEAVKGILVAARAGKWGKALWEAFKILQGPIRKGIGWLDKLLGG